MPYRRRIQVKKPTNIIEIETLSERIWKGVQNRKTPLLILVGGILLFGVAISGYFYYSGLSERRAQDLEFAAYSEYTKSTKLSGAEKGKQLKSAIDLYQKIMMTYPKTKTAGLASFYLGNAYVDLKDYDKAIEYYQKSVTSLSLDEMMRGVVHLRLGYVYLYKNDNDKALSEFSQVEKNPLTRNQDFAAYEIGRIYEAQGKKNEALGEYESLVKTYPSSPLTGEVSSKISEIKGPSAATANPGTATPVVPSK
ncbi:MAG: YfgM family protein [Nitrospiria bacterium]